MSIPKEKGNADDVGNERNSKTAESNGWKLEKKPDLSSFGGNYYHRSGDTASRKDKFNPNGKRKKVCTRSFQAASRTVAAE